MRNVLLAAILLLMSSAITARADVKRSTPFDLEAYNIAFAVDSLVREKGWGNLDLSSTEAVFRALVDARSLDLGDNDREAFIRNKSEHFRVVANSQAVCVVDLKKKSAEYDGPLVLYFEYRFKRPVGETITPTPGR